MGNTAKNSLTTLVVVTGVVSSILGIAADAPAVLKEELDMTSGELYFAAGLIIVSLAFLMTIWSSEIAHMLPMWEWRLRRLLLNRKWAFYFDPGTKTSKVMGFTKNGKVIESPNVNEDSWELIDGELLIYRQCGKLQNRFRWDAKQQMFLSTNEQECYAIHHFKRKGQYIRPL